MSIRGGPRICGGCICKTRIPSSIHEVHGLIIPGKKQGGFTDLKPTK